MNCRALLEGELERAVVSAGFVDFEINSRIDVFAGAEQASSASNFGTLGIAFRARKASSDEEWQRVAAARLGVVASGAEARGGR